MKFDGPVELIVVFLAVDDEMFVAKVGAMAKSFAEIVVAVVFKTEVKVSLHATVELTVVFTAAEDVVLTVYVEDMVEFFAEVVVAVAFWTGIEV